MHEMVEGNSLCAIKWGSGDSNYPWKKSDQIEETR